MAAVAEDVFERIETPISGVPSWGVMKVWDRVEPLLDKVVKPESGWDMHHVLNALQTASMQLWVIDDFKAVVVTYVQPRPLHNVLWIQFLAGTHMSDWLDDWIAVQEEFAKFNHCAAIEFAGRDGWKKITEQHPEYKPILTTIRRNL